MRLGSSHGPIVAPMAVAMIAGMNYELFMGEALAEARQAAARGAPPVGAIAVMNDAMVARGSNRVAEGKDPTAHAVMAVIREAARKLKHHVARRRDDLHHDRALPDVRRRAPRVRRGGARLRGPEPVSGAAGTVVQLAADPRLVRRFDVVSGIRRGEAEELMGDLAGAVAGA